MGFLDSFQQSFEKDCERSLERQKKSHYKTVVQKENEFRSLNSDILLNKANSEYSSKEDRERAGKILEERGFKKVNEKYGRKQLED